jgi:hypothetical protein
MRELWLKYLELRVMVMVFNITWQCFSYILAVSCKGGGNRRNPRPVAGHWLIPRSVAGHWLTPRPVAGHWLTPRSVAGHWLTPRPVAGHWLTLRPVAGHWLTLRHVAGHWLTTRSVAGHWLTPRPVAGHWLTLEIFMFVAWKHYFPLIFLWLIYQNVGTVVVVIIW